MNSHDEPEMGPLLSGIGRLADFKSLDEDDLPRLAEEIREFLVGAVARTGGHIGPNLGVVELTMAVHRVFDSPHDQIVFDTGHQSYVHKALTGRAGHFAELRRRGGLTGYPARPSPRTTSSRTPTPPPPCPTPTAWPRRTRCAASGGMWWRWWATAR